MASLIRRRSGGPILRGPNGALARGLACCCGINACCDRLDPIGTVPEHFPETLNLVLTNITDCGCIDGIGIPLVWNATNHRWEGTGPGGPCALLFETWYLSCGSNPVQDPFEEDCQNFELSIAETTPCTMDSEFPLPGCTCNPLHLDYDLHVNGIGCCDGAMDGSGDVHAEITE